ncbi:uncharacterized protein LOC1280243 [Anopheles gambiae]|uniref:uncharacterized protein LOC1280243 n=1 Tax=Anopheles gambiae TaxID=7165 RepID=UPI002AC91D33|nr:uncharacterized protein LOC1280243 [Anopheles gambiae]
MAELEQWQEFASQIAKPDRSIRCNPDGIGFGQFAIVCSLPGAPENVQKLIDSPVAKLHKQASTEHDSNTSTEDIVKILIEQLPCFGTLEQYAWLVRATVALHLLKGVPTKVSSLVRKLSGTVAGLDLACFRHSTFMIHTVAKSLKEDIPLEGVNLLHAIKKLALANSPQLYYTALALIFAGFDTITHPNKPIATYRVGGVNEALQLLDTLDAPWLQRQCASLQTIYQLLKLLSLYQNMVIMRHAGKRPQELQEEHASFAALLCATDAQVKSIRQWLEQLSVVLQPYGIRQDEDHLIIADLIHVDMLPLFDDWDQHEEMM